jgi:hypothetical protein
MTATPSRFVRYRQALVGAGLALLATWGGPSAVEAAGPWRGQVVDAETGQPLEGVAVIGVWQRRFLDRRLVPLSPTSPVSADETVTDADGRFTLPPRMFWRTVAGPVREPEPELALFKAGYGGWRRQRPGTPLRTSGAVLEMQPLRSLDERRQYLRGAWPPAEREQRRLAWQHGDHPANWIDLPYRQARRYEAAINEERVALGLRPIGIGYPELWTKSLAPAPPSTGPEAARLRGASAIAIGADGLRYVADTEHHRIVVFDATGAMVRTWGRFGREPGVFQYPRGLAFDRRGMLLVADWGNHRIQRFRPDGRFLGQFGGLRFEDFDGMFNPEMLGGTDGGEIVVQDYAIYTFFPSGQRLDARRLAMRTESRCKVAVDSDGYLYVVSAFPDKRVHELDHDGPILASFGYGYGDGAGYLFDPIGLTVDAQGCVWVADWLRGHGRVHGFAPDGRHLGTWSVGDDGQRLRDPQGIAVDGQGRIVVADRSQLWRRSHRMSRTERPECPTG